MRHDAHYVEELARTNRSVGRIIPINQIEPNPDQPRVEIGDLTELANSIKEKGVLEPLLVKPHPSGRSWMIIAGERRWRAATIAGLLEVPCIELDIDDQSIAEIALIENLQRKDLTIWEEADGFVALAKRFGYTHDDIAKKIGKSRSTITESMSIAGLPEKIRDRCLAAKISSKSTLLELARQFDEKAMEELLDNIQSRNLNRQEIRQTVRPQAVSKPVNSVSDPSSSSFSKASSGAKAADKPVSHKTNRIFQYVSRSRGFSIDIKFNDINSYTNEDIAEALEEVLRAVKKQ